jgi:glycosyltransferase involved in cell wall biosynthesis
VLKAYSKLLRQYWRVKDFDVLVVGYPGQIDVFLARLLASLRRKPLVWDVFMSVYLVALERGLDSRNRFTVNALRRLERTALRLPDKLVQDTQDYVAWLAETHGVAPERFGLVPTGADDRVFTPQGEAETDDIRVIYYGTYIPNHGVEKIVEAARLLADMPKIRFELIGDGPERARAETAARDLALENVQFLGWMEKDALVRHAGSGAVCLGAFGDTPQSLMTVQNKIFEGLAMARPVLTGDSPAVRRVFTHKDQVYLCERSGKGIAEAIRELASDQALRARLAREGRRIFEEQYDLENIGRQFRRILEGVLGRRK